MSHPYRLKELTPAAAAHALRERPRLLVPAGALESRGPHLPLGCDTLILDRLAADVSAATGVLVAPTVEFGVHSSRDETCPGLASLSRKTLHRTMNELIAAWETQAKVRQVFILTAHAADAHQEALSTIRAVGTVSLIDIFNLDFSDLGIDPGRPIHGGEIDTSIVLFLYPPLVAWDRIPARLEASATQGERFYRRIVERVVASVGS